MFLLPVLTSDQQASSAQGGRDAVFQSTMWSQVRLAADTHRPNSPEALEALCRLYWAPVYAFLRRWGRDHHSAQDLTQGFFSYLLEGKLIGKATPERGRFRSFLLATLKFFVSNENARERAVKRGGRTVFVPLDEPGTEPQTQLSPERSFERKWAMTVLEEAMSRLSAEYLRAGMEKDFQALGPYLTGEAEEHLGKAGAALGKTDGAARVALFRMRNRFRRLLRSVIADTVTDADQVEAELRFLEEALRPD